MVDINEYARETTCEYKGEVYSVRDNGAVMRHAREGKKARKLDNVWTFGTKDKARGDDKLAQSSYYCSQGIHSWQ